MIGRSAKSVSRPTGSGARAGVAAVAVDAFASGDHFHDVSFAVAPGEVVALYGKIGSGAAEIAEALFGLHPVTEGSATLAGTAYAPSNPNHAVRCGIGFLPADRQRAGAFMARPVAENLAAPSWRRMARWGIVQKRLESDAYRRWQQTLSIKSRRDPAQLIGTLSGGNQQKVLLARWFERGTAVLVLVEPTRGVDVGARDDIYRTLRERAAHHGTAIIVSTSDYEEVVQLADRVLVVSRGEVVADLTGEDVTSTALTAAAGG